MRHLQLLIAIILALTSLATGLAGFLLSHTKDRYTPGILAMVALAAGSHALVFGVASWQKFRAEKERNLAAYRLSLKP